MIRLSVNFRRKNKQKNCFHLYDVNVALEEMHLQMQSDFEALIFHLALLCVFTFLSFIFVKCADFRAALYVRHCMNIVAANENALTLSEVIFIILTFYIMMKLLIADTLHKQCNNARIYAEEHFTIVQEIYSCENNS